MLRRARPLISLSAKATKAMGAPNRSLGQRLSLQGVSQQDQGALTSRPSFFGAARLQCYSSKRTTGPEEEYAKKVMGIDPEQRQKIAQEKLKPNPDGVSVDSSVRHIYEPRKTSGDNPEVSRQSLRADFETVKDTFNLSSVPPLSYKLGLAGTLPYLGTSLSTVFLSWNLNTPWPTSSNFLNSIMFSQPEDAAYYLHLLEPIQLGYGAVIISFLGAIHWGLEYAEKTPDPPRTKFRYGMGVVAPMLAWPTLLLPIEYALIGQFAAFTGLYFADSRAATRGWAPPWYGTYRFVLTFVVGSAIFVSLLWRARIEDHGGNVSAARNIVESKEGGQAQEMPREQWVRLETEEKERLAKEKEEEERKKKKEKQDGDKKQQERKGSGDADDKEKTKDGEVGQKAGADSKKGGSNDDKSKGKADEDQKSKQEGSNESKSKDGEQEDKQDEKQGKQEKQDKKDKKDGEDKN